MSNKIINYYKSDKDITWVATQVFSDKHFGAAITNDELEERLKLMEKYKDEIGLVK